MTLGEDCLRSRGAALNSLRRGGVVLCPTEGVWGLSCDPASQVAVARLLDLKRRPVRKGLILAAADAAQFRPWAAPWRTDQARTLAAAWPGPTTWVVPARLGASRWVTGGKPGVALRVPAHPALRSLCRAFGAALVTTSANLTGTPAPAGGRLAAMRRFARRDLPVWPGSLQQPGRPSRILDLVTGATLRP